MDVKGPPGGGVEFAAARRAGGGDCASSWGFGADAVSLAGRVPGRRRSGAGAAGKGRADARDRRIAELEAQIEKRDQVIGEYTIANRILKKLSDQSRLSEESRAMITSELQVDNAPAATAADAGAATGWAWRRRVGIAGRATASESVRARRRKPIADGSRSRRWWRWPRRIPGTATSGSP